jgi:hypothetical protein
MVLRRLFRLSSLFFNAHALAPLCLVGERGPGSFRPTATLAHMLECRRFSLVASLIGAREEELQV